MTSARQRKKRLSRKGPSAPRVIGANDNHLLGANDDDAIVVRGITLTKNQARRMLEAEADQASNDLGRRKSGRDAMAVLNAEIELEVLVVERSIQADETVALERSRGNRPEIEWVKGKDADGKDERRALPQVRIATRDGLETLRASGSITKTEYDAGRRYRTDYERIDPERNLTPPTWLREGKRKGGGGEGYDTKIIDSWTTLRTIQLMVAGLPIETARRTGGDHRERPNMPNLPTGHPAIRALYALNQIAGEGRNPSEMTNSGGTRGRLVKGLQWGLHCAAIVYGLE